MVYQPAKRIQPSVVGTIIFDNQAHKKYQGKK